MVIEVTVSTLVRIKTSTGSESKIYTIHPPLDEPFRNLNTELS